MAHGYYKFCIASKRSSSVQCDFNEKNISISFVHYFTCENSWLKIIAEYDVSIMLWEYLNQLFK